MNSEAVKKEHIASIDIALYPFISALHSLHIYPVSTMIG